MRGKRATYDRGFQITRHIVRSKCRDISSNPLKFQNVPTFFNKFEEKRANIALYIRREREGINY